jgi:alpha-beta hydrolase superfamily lysophospholipase
MQTESKPHRWKIFLINGLAQNAQHWNPQLLESLRGCDWVDDVSTMDLPGAGQMSGHRSPTQVAHYVPMMRQFYEEELATDCPRLLVALSLGGMVASEWCAQHPDDFQKLILINTSFGKFAASRERLQPAAWLTFAAVVFGRSRTARERRALKLVSNDPEKRAAMLPHWIEARRQHPTGHLNSLRQLIAAKRYTAPPSLPENTVVVCSRHDRLCHYTAGERIASHYRVPIIVDSTPTIGHAFHVDGVDQLTAIIENCVTPRSEPG